MINMNNSANKNSNINSNTNNHLVLGICAHVDSGKTTLSESMLYLTGQIRKSGRVDHGDAFLDTDAMEKQRGITIFSKQAELQIDDLRLTLLDTPGHVDFSPEMERVLQVLDYAVLVVSAADGVTAQVKTLWKLFAHYQLPVFIFVNKMDQNGADRSRVLEELRKELSDGCIDILPSDFSETSIDINTVNVTDTNTVNVIDTNILNSTDTSDAYEMLLNDDTLQEELAARDEHLIEAYLEGEKITLDDVRQLISRRQVFPVWFGAALHHTGVKALLQGIKAFASVPVYDAELSAKVFKISRDKNNTRLTWLKLTGGELHPKDQLTVKGKKNDEAVQEKVDQIRIYSGEHFQAVSVLHAGEIAAVSGLQETYIGQVIGKDMAENEELLQPVFTNEVIPSDEADRVAVIQALRVLEEEEPLLHIKEDRLTSQIYVQVMGNVQIEILTQLLKERFSLRVHFGPGRIVYKETIAHAVEGVGHFEPLRHYAEVHLLMEPLPAGSGLVFDSSCSTDDLDRNWQRLILTHLEEREHLGVLTGAEITDMKITVIGGRAHNKHTEGGDFRQAVYRAVRQGLMQAQNVLLEPMYRFHAELPMENVGRFLTDIQRMQGSTEPVSVSDRPNISVIDGSVPASEFGEYQKELTEYTHGVGELALTLQGYAPCHNAEDVILGIGYDADADTDNPSGSVFCSHGAGTYVQWDQVRNYMHVDTGWRDGDAADDADDFSDENLMYTAGWQRDVKNQKSWKERERESAAGEDELRAIFERTYGKIKDRSERRGADDGGYFYEQPELTTEEIEQREALLRENTKHYEKKQKPDHTKTDYLLVDGYNVIFSWPELAELAQNNIDASRDALIEILVDYQGYRNGELILVFDAYKVHGGKGEHIHWHNIHVVYTKEAETADAYIEKTVHEIAGKHHVTVATSDGLEQMIILGEGARRMSSRELREEIQERKKMTRINLEQPEVRNRNYLGDNLSEQAKEVLRSFISE